MAASRNNRRRRKNRRRFGMLLKLMTIAALIAAVAFGATVFFQVEDVLVEGNSRYTEEEVVAVSAIETGDNLFRLNRNAISLRLRQELPYIESLSIQLKLPNMVLIRIQEWEAVAEVTCEGGNWLISVGGKLLEQGERKDKIQITGVTPLVPQVGTAMVLSQEESVKYSSLLALLSALEQRNTLDKVTYIDMSGELNIVMDYDGRFTVKVPLAADYVYKLRALEAAVTDQGEYRSGTMDLTQEQYPVVFAPDGNS